MSGECNPSAPRVQVVVYTNSEGKTIKTHLGSKDCPPFNTPLNVEAVPWWKIPGKQKRKNKHR
jgi:hypothetical protein